MTHRKTPAKGYLLARVSFRRENRLLNTILPDFLPTRIQQEERAPQILPQTPGSELTRAKTRKL